MGRVSCYYACLWCCCVTCRLACRRTCRHLTRKTDSRKRRSFQSTMNYQRKRKQQKKEQEDEKLMDPKCFHVPFRSVINSNPETYMDPDGKLVEGPPLTKQQLIAKGWANETDFKDWLWDCTNRARFVSVQLFYKC